MAKFEFETNTTFWRPLHARWLAEAARLAYQEPAQIKAAVKTWGFTRFHFLDRKSTQAFIIADNDVILIAFRGTQPDHLEDLITDAALELVAFPGRRGKVHQGVWTALNLMWKDLLEAIRVEQKTGQSIWLTGHSLGAALATLATARFRLDMDKPVNGLYTFGQPRVGDRDFAARFNADFKMRTFRYVNNNDVVTRVPTRRLGYSHLGTFLYFDTAGSLQNDISWWNRFVETVKGEMEDFLKPGADFVKDHSIDIYAANCAKQANLSKRLVLADTLFDS